MPGTPTGRPGDVVNHRHSIPAVSEWPNKESVIRSMYISHYYLTHHMSDESDEQAAEKSP